MRGKTKTTLAIFSSHFFFILLRPSNGKNKNRSSTKNQYRRKTSKDFHRIEYKKFFSHSLEFILCSYSDLFELDADMGKNGQSVSEKIFKGFFL